MMQPPSLRIPLPANSLLVLCGPAGAGKSTFAAQHFKPTQIVSSDRCRALLYDSERYQGSNRATFALFHFLIHQRLQLGRLTVADSTALHTYARAPLLEMAQQAGFHATLLVFTVPFETCWQRAAQRERQIPLEVILQQCETLQDTRQHIQQEPWNQVYPLGTDDVSRVRFVRQKRRDPSPPASQQGTTGGDQQRAQGPAPAPF